MSAGKATKINQLLTSQPFGIVLQSDWLIAQGYNPDLKKCYRKGRWLKSIGTGAMIRTGDTVGYEGAIYALQKQSALTVHAGGRTALWFLGKAHYLELSAKKAVLFGNKGERLPAWFHKYDWGIALDYYPTSFLPPGIGMVEVDRATTLICIGEALERVNANIEKAIPKVHVSHKKEIGKLIAAQGVDVKLEANLVARGILSDPVKMQLCEIAQNDFDAFCIIPVVPVGQLYGGKICAALDRQHPRDLFDVKYIMANEGFSEQVKTGFLYCLLMG